MFAYSIVAVMIKKNIVIELKITSITNLGFGVGRYCGTVVFVSGTVTGDEVAVKIIKVTSSYAVGRVEKFITRSDVRDGGRCENVGCTGCAYKNVSYEYELALKHAEVKQAFVKAGMPEVNVCPVTPSPKTSEYRNKAQYPIATDKNGDYVIGFFAPKSHRVTEARNCPLAPAVFSEINGTLAEFFGKHGISVYNEKTGKGLLRHIYLRRGEVSGEILLTLVINGEALPFSNELTALIREKHKDVVGVLLNINTKNTNVILGERFITLYGRDFIYDTLCGVRLKITAPSFYQVNHGAAELLYKKARELACPSRDDVLLDLYCGTGSIGLSMADAVGEFVGVEIVESAVECARENAREAGFTNAHFYVGDAANTERMLDNAEREFSRRIEPSVILLDPPRAGCDERLIRYAASLSPKRIVYISCNPATLARDVKFFSELGYECGDVYPFDLFCMSGHVETVVCLCKQ